VSRAFTPGSSISDETRARIMRAAKKLGYQPNLIARSLSTRRSNIIGVVIGSLENPFYAEVVKGLSETLAATGRHILLFAPSSGRPDEAEIEAFLSYQVDALILTARSPSPNLVLDCRRQGVPIVVINREATHIGVSTVHGQNRRGAETIAEFLIAGGHRRYAFIGGNRSSSISESRQVPFCERIRRGTGDAVLVRYGDYTFAGGAAATRELLARPDRPDAIFCASDHMAFGALDVAEREYGLRRREDISIVGFDDVREARLPPYDLTTFSQPPEALAANAIQMVDAQLSRRGVPAERREVRGELIIRSSARLPAGHLMATDYLM
jgi:DNA-binding LacI/PurR family transcriptional regulator